MTSELEVAPKVPPDWRDWINEFPTIKAVALTCVIAWIITPIAMTVAGWLISVKYINGQQSIDGVKSLFAMWLDALNWLTAAAVFGVVGKRATEKPDLVRAEAEAKATQAVAAATVDAVKKTAEFQVTPQPVGKPHPATDPEIVDAIEHGVILQAEARERAERGHGDD